MATERLRDRRGDVVVDKRQEIAGEAGELSQFLDAMPGVRHKLPDDGREQFRYVGFLLLLVVRHLNAIPRYSICRELSGLTLTEH